MSNAAHFHPSTDDVFARIAGGVREFPSQAEFAEELRAAGFEAVQWRNLTFGIVAIHEAKKPC